MNVKAIPFMLAALLPVASCRSSDPQSSSSSHFVSCQLDVDCLGLAGAAGCDGEQCVDMQGNELMVEGSTDVDTTPPASGDPHCDPTAPIELGLELNQVLLVAEDEAGKLWVVELDDGEYRAFESDGDRLVPIDVLGSGSSSDEVLLTVINGDGIFSISFSPEENPQLAMLYAGDIEERPERLDPEAPGTQTLTVQDEAALDDYDLSPAVSAVEVEYHARSPEGHEVVVVRPDRYFEYESMRLFLAKPGEDELVERRLIEVQRAGDGGTTNMTFWADGDEALAYFPIEFDGEQFVSGDAELTLGGETFSVERTDETVDGLADLRFVCFETPPNGWRESNESPPSLPAPADDDDPNTFPDSATSDVELAGVYRNAFEASTFSRCNAEQSWWTEFTGAAWETFSASHDGARCDDIQGCAYFVAGVGDVSAVVDGGFGNQGAWDREVTFTSLDQFIPISAAAETAPCPSPEELTILGHVVGPDGQSVTADAIVEVLTFEEWEGEVPNGSGPYFDTETSDSFFTLRVPPGRWGALASFGTCNSAPLTEVAGEAGEVVGVELVVNCAE